MFDKFVIPNENTAASGTNKIMKYHLKSNYIASVNPTKITSLTFNITNEDGETVNTNVESSATATVTTNSVPVNSSSEFTHSSSNDFKINDIIYNGNKAFIGVITKIDTNKITIGGGTTVALGVGEELFLSSFKTNTLVNNGDNIPIDSKDIATDGGNATSNFSEDSKVYLGNGAFVGKATAVTANKITIGDGTQVYLTDNDILYNGNPLGTVFASNSKSNRISMEFVLIGR